MMSMRRLCTLLACTLLLWAAIVDAVAVRQNGWRKYIVMSQRNVGLQNLANILSSYGVQIDPTKVVQQTAGNGVATAVSVDLPSDAVAQAVLNAAQVAAVEPVVDMTLPPLTSTPQAAVPQAAVPQAAAPVAAAAAAPSFSTQYTSSPTGDQLNQPWAVFAGQTLGNAQCAPWHLDRIDQRALPLDCIYSVNGTGNGVDVYVVDTGVNIALSEFGGRASNFFAPAGSTPDDNIGHGTFVANLVAGATYGVAKNANIKSVKVFNDSGAADSFTIFTALNTILQNRDPTRNAIVTMSLNGPQSTLIEAMVAQLLANNVLVVSAAGNLGGGSAADDACQFSPGASAASLTVGATDLSDKMASWSNYGSCVKILAPGQDIFSILPNGTHRALSGTSMATPIVTGTAAILWSLAPTITARQVFRAVVQNGAVNFVDNSTLRGSPNVVVNADFTVLPAPSAADLQSLPGVPITPCTPSTCPATSSFTAVAQLADGRRRIARDSSAKVYVSSDSGATYFSTPLTASSFSSIGFYFNIVSGRWECINNGLYVTSKYMYGLAAVCFQRRAYLVHDLVGPYFNEVFFRMEQDPAFPIYNVRRVDTYGFNGAAPTLLTPLQNIWLYSWRGAPFVTNPDGSISYIGEEWSTPWVSRRFWLSMLPQSPNLDPTYRKTYFQRLLPWNVNDDWSTTWLRRPWWLSMVPQQFDFVVSGTTYSTYPPLYFGGGTIDPATLSRGWADGTTLGSAWSQYKSSYVIDPSMVKFRAGYNLTTWRATVNALPDLFSAQSLIGVIFVNGPDLQIQYGGGKEARITPRGTLEGYVTNGNTVVDTAGAPLTPTPLNPSGLDWSGSQSIFYAAADLFQSTGNITSFSWTSQGYYSSWVTGCSWWCK